MIIMMMNRNSNQISLKQVVGRRTGRLTTQDPKMTDYESSPDFFSWKAGGIAVDHISFRFWISGVSPKIFAIKVENCQKSR